MAHRRSVIACERADVPYAADNLLGIQDGFFSGGGEGLNGIQNGPLEPAGVLGK